MDKYIVNYVENNSYLDYESKDDDVLSFSTRKNGSVASETYSKLDLNEAIKIKRKLLKEFNSIDVTIDIVDEWVLLNVNTNTESKIKYRYGFAKKNISNNSGFGESFNTFDDLLNKYKGWCDIDWLHFKNVLDNMGFYEAPFHRNNFETKPILLTKEGSYEYFLIKYKIIS